MGRKSRNSGPTPWWLLLIEIAGGLGGIWFLYLVAANALQTYVGGL